jgi:hypothetical protein
MSRWLKNVGNFLDQLDTKAADAVTAAVSGGRHPNDDDDDDDYYQAADNTTTTPHQSTNNTLLSNTISTTGIDMTTNSNTESSELFPYDKNWIQERDADDGNEPKIVPVLISKYEPDDVNNNNDDQHTTGVVSLPVETTNNEGWGAVEDEIDCDNEGIVVEGSSGGVNVKNNIEINNDIGITDKQLLSENDNDNNVSYNCQIISDQQHDIQNNTWASTNEIEPSSMTEEDSNPIDSESNPSVVESDNNNNNDFAVPTEEENSNINSERIIRLEYELQQYQDRLQQLQHEKQHEVLILSKEARTLRRHLATLNEQLAAADKEVGAQRLELENAAQRIEKDQMKYKQDIQTLQNKHTIEIQQIKQSHQESITAIQAQAQSQIESLKKDIHNLHQQRQQEGGDWNKELEDAFHREKIALHECKSLQEEKDTLIAQIETLQLQQESLGSRLESLTAIADNAVIREREVEIQLDNAISLHAKQINQRQVREAELERTVSELSALLVQERSKNANMMITNSNGTLQSPGDTTSQQESNNAVLEIDNLKSQLELERQQNASLRHELDNMIHERQDEAIVTQTRQVQHDNKVSELTQQVLELRATVRDTKHDTSIQRQSDQSTLDAQRIQELTEEIVRMRERITISNSESAALRNRLQAALNRVIVAEAAAESTFTTVSSSSLSQQQEWTSNNNDLESGYTVRRRGLNNKNKNQKGLTDVPTIRTALRLDSFQGNGNGTTSSQSIGKSLDILDTFLAQSGEILRFNPIARLFFGKCIMYLSRPTTYFN